MKGNRCLGASNRAGYVELAVIRIILLRLSSVAREISFALRRLWLSCLHLPRTGTSHSVTAAAAPQGGTG